MDKLASMKEQHAKSVDSICAIEAEALPKSVKALAQSRVCVANAAEKFRKVKASSFVLRLRDPFVYPASHFVPPLLNGRPKFCQDLRRKVL